MSLLRDEADEDDRGEDPGLADFGFTRFRRDGGSTGARDETRSILEVMQLQTAGEEIGTQTSMLCQGLACRLDAQPRNIDFCSLLPARQHNNAKKSTKGGKISGAVRVGQ